MSHSTGGSNRKAAREPVNESSITSQGVAENTLAHDSQTPTTVNRRALFRVAAATAGVALVSAPALGASAAGPTPTPAAEAKSASSAPSTAAAAAAAVVVVGDTSRVYYPEQFGFKPADANHTVAMNAFFAALQKTGGTGILPPCEIRVTSTGIDYSSAIWPKQAASGAPYGYPAINIEGYGRRVTTIKQITGSTADLFVVKGKLAADAGPAANNKASVTMTGFSMTGTKTGGHGLYLRSLLHSRFTDIEINASGKAGVYFARVNFTAASDEYSYANVIEGLRVILAGTWGVDCDGINAIDIVMRDTEIVSAVTGGIRIAPTNAKFENTRILGCGSTIKEGRGFVAIPTSNASSMISELNIDGMRLEGNSGPGGYQLEIGAGVGATINGYNIVTGLDKGAHGIGVGVTTAGGSRVASNTLVGRGTMFMTPSKYPNQKAVVVGPDGRDTRVEMPALPNNPDAPYDSVISNSGTRTVDTFGRTLPSVPFVA